MQRFRQSLLELWRESCQHGEIDGLVQAITPQLAEHLPIAFVLVREFATSRRAVETVALTTVDAPTGLNDSPVECTPGDWKKLVAWAKSGELWHEQTSQAESVIIPLLVPKEFDGDVAAIPLADEQGPIGALVFGAVEGKRFLASHQAMIGELGEPFVSALANDQKRRELTTLREKAEADRRSLLTRLGRKEMSEVVVGADKGLRLVMERVELVAIADAPVLLLGETGSGKEVIARAIHERSARSAGPFIRVNCGAIPSELIDSQLFGHEKGSFTGASDQRQGWFERADGGTLFLDEIGELPLPAQVRLLRVLQDHHFERVGGQNSVHVDVRIVAATHRDLAEMVKRGSFREDLWYRINVFPILLPRLCERQEDIPDLVRHFARRAAQRFGLPYVEATAADLLMLASYDWPGNIRELAAVIDRATILGRGTRLEIATSLGWSDRGAPGGAKPQAEFGAAANAITPPGTPSFPATNAAGTLLSLDAAIAQHIERALVAARGRIEGRKGAAELLRINPHTLRAKMRKLGVEWSKYRE